MLETNLLEAIYNLYNLRRFDLLNIYSDPKKINNNRINNMGIALEYFIKDILCNTITDQRIADKERKYSDYLSYTGNQNNPPDCIIRNGDSLEVKKLEGLTSGLALNSSYPKSKLYSDSPLITEACRVCEKWDVKDIIYSIGVVDKNKKDNLKLLWFLYGDCYAANIETYEKLRTAIRGGLNEFPNVHTETNELGRVNAVDPLGITYLRIRGMWHIDNPIKVFDYVLNYDESNKFTMYSLMRRQKYDLFPYESKKKIESIEDDNFSIQNITIKNPDNPAQYIEAKLISFIIK